MARISISSADSVSKAEADKKFNDVISKLETKISEVATSEFKKENKFPKIEDWLYEEGWVRRSGSVTLSRDDIPGYRNKTLNINLINFMYPTKSYMGTMGLKDSSGKVIKAVQEWEKKKEEKRLWQRKLHSAILSCVTDTKLRVKIPELAKYFPEKGLSVIPDKQIEEIRKELP